MEYLSSNLFVGVISGLVTTLIVFTGVWFWKNVVLKWAANSIYKGVRIEGSWTLEEKLDGNGESIYSQNETLEIEQNASGITGRLMLEYEDNGKKHTRSLQLLGSVRDRFVIFTCTPSTKRNLGYVSFLGEISGDGTLICGSSVYFDTASNKIRTIKADYKRLVQ